MIVVPPILHLPHLAGERSGNQLNAHNAIQLFSLFHRLILAGGVKPENPLFLKATEPLQRELLKRICFGYICKRNRDEYKLLI